MDPALVQTTLIEVLQAIQAASGLDCPPLAGGTKPVEALPKFDSKIWPVAIGMLGAKLGVAIASDVNIFRQEKSTVALTIDEAVAMVVAIAQAQVPAEAKLASA